MGMDVTIPGVLEFVEGGSCGALPELEPVATSARNLGSLRSHHLRWRRASSCERCVQSLFSRTNKCRRPITDKPKPLNGQVVCSALWKN